MRALFVVLCGAVVLWAPTHVMNAQRPATTAPTPAQEAAGRGGRGPAGRAGFSEPLPADDLMTQRRLYKAGNRTYWHTHEKGFLILVESGRARVQKRGEPMKELGPGDVDYTPPNVFHWHGAAPGTDFVQIGVLFGGGINFTEPVSDEEYTGRK